MNELLFKVPFNVIQDAGLFIPFHFLILSSVETNSEESLGNEKY